MMERFGSWSEYRAAPRAIVEEQIIAWSSKLKAEADINKEQNPPS